MSLTIYLTTDENEDQAEKCDCLVSIEKPSLSSIGEWRNPSEKYLHVGSLKRADLAALGFPRPGEMRVVDIGEYKETI